MLLCWVRWQIYFLLHLTHLYALHHSAYTTKSQGKYDKMKIELIRCPECGQIQNEDGFRFSLRWVTGGMQIMEIAGFWYPCIWNEPEMSHEEIMFVVLERIEHVHQLQNLYHAIRQEELIFEL